MIAQYIYHKILFVYLSIIISPFIFLFFYLSICLLWYLLPGIPSTAPFTHSFHRKSCITISIKCLYSIQQLSTRPINLQHILPCLPVSPVTYFPHTYNCSIHHPIYLLLNVLRLKIRAAQLFSVIHLFFSSLISSYVSCILSITFLHASSRSTKTIPNVPIVVAKRWWANSRYECRAPLEGIGT